MRYNLNCHTVRNGALFCSSADGSIAYRYWVKHPVLLDSRPADCVTTSASNTGCFVMTWEVDWDNPNNKWPKIWARNKECHIKRCREWGPVSVYTLRRAGVNTPVFRSDSWEIDWSKRDGKRVWARNPSSKMPSSREWHWIEQSTTNWAGLRWKPIKSPSGRSVDKQGYVTLRRIGMTDEDIELAEQYGLFRGAKKAFVKEHRLVAAKKYRCDLSGMVVRHLNGIKTDNRPENLVIGTTQENTADHNTARLMAMFWHRKYLDLVAQVASGEVGKWSLLEIDYADEK